MLAQRWWCGRMWRRGASLEHGVTRPGGEERSSAPRTAWPTQTQPHGTLARWRRTQGRGMRNHGDGCRPRRSYWAPPPAPAAVHTGGIKRVGAVAAVATAGERAVRLAFEPSVTYAAGSQARAPPHKAPTAARAAGTVSATSLSWSGEFTHESKLLYGDYQMCFVYFRHQPLKSMTKGQSK